MEAQASINSNLPPPKNGPQLNQQKRNARRKQLQHSADIVFTKGTSIQTLPCLSKQLKAVTECIVGLQYVWEYRSPSKSVPPHYQCKLCAVSRLQHDMLAHVRGWKHSFRYLKKIHPDKVTHEEEEAIRDPAVRKTIKEVAAEVEKTEGRGQLKVILKEPCEVPAFKGLRTAAPKVMPPPPPPGMGLKGPPFGPRFSDPRFPGEFPPQGGPHSDYPGREYGEPGFGGYSNSQDFHDCGMDQRPFPDGMDQRPFPDGMDRRPFGDGMGRPGGDNFGPGGGRDGYGRSGLMEESPSRMYSDEYQGSQMGNSLMDRPMEKSIERPGLMGAAPENNSLPNTLLNYLDSFRIENENDAQLVLKVTQKLTDVLMEYRLRSVSKGSSLSSLSMSSTSFSSTPSRLPSSSDRYTSNFSGPSRYSDGPPRFYK
ncbi:hypothetical protein D5F01_LYC12647 [Larimichthys crocea]|uniref:Uncharacterized protein n=2 Tax=Larimichthys crocea TaxID=215358 RepID=A0ACD3QU06_LARCR|nr:uncharacterized protein LOC104923029 [Larimichthys crocea]KAE8288771.1 hypothetical protein D5F01_LYC12647 [Larimichthys crocea]TMS10344.1 hypothetical protein E3U43_019337 [Larimichthys crocea]